MLHPLKVFLCHASEDKPAVRNLYQKLALLGIDIWFDEEKLLPGMEWDVEISEAVRSADVVIVCLSSSVAKTGYIQKEIRISLDIADEKPEKALFIIPAKLEECIVPIRLNKWQWVDLFQKDGFQKLIQSLEQSAESLGRTQPKETRLEQPSYGNIEFVQVKAGSFLMGSKNDNPHASNWEKPQHVFSLSYDFFIGRYPVTDIQYHQFILENQPQEEWTKGLQGGSEYPAVNISWHKAMKFCEWLNHIYIKELPENMQFRLPTEAEWEKAARGTFGNEWPWGNEWRTGLCNNYGNYPNTITPVRYYSPVNDSPYGVSDMVGNVWEWTLNLWGISQEKSDFYYPYNRLDGRENTKAGNHILRVLRGGSFQDTSNYVRCASRRGGYPLLGWPSSGFRVAICPIESFSTDMK